MKKILYLINTLEIGGAEIQLLEFLKNIDKTNIQPIVGVIVRSGELYPEYKNAKLKIKFFNRKGKISLSTLIKLIKFINKNEISAIHSSLYEPNFWGSIAGWLCKKPVIIELPGFGFGPYDSKPSINIKKFFLNYIAGKFANIIIVNSIATKKLSHQKYLMPLRKMRLVYNVIALNKTNLSLETPEYSLNFPGKQALLNPLKLKVAAIGRFIKCKGLEYLLRAIKTVLKSIPQSEFFLIGDGPLKIELKQLANELGISNKVHFTGFITNIELIYKLLDVVVVPSLWEGFCNIIIEAGKHSKCVVASNTGAIPEIIIHRENGILTEPANSDNLSDSLIEVLKDRKLRETLGTKLFATVKEKFNMKIKIEKIKKIYEELNII